MTSKRLLLAGGTVVVLAVIGVGLAQLAGGSPAGPEPTTARLTPAEMRAGLVGSPPVLAALHAQADQLLGGGAEALHARLEGLHGTPVVINKWASWCEPCRSEFTAFEHASVDLGRRVAFLGIDSGDTSRTDALAFLRSYPLSYPSYYDHSGSLGTSITDSSFMPVTVFYDHSGSEYIHQGPYPSLAKLEADIRRYALDA